MLSTKRLMGMVQSGIHRGVKLSAMILSNRRFDLHMKPIRLRNSITMIMVWRIRQSAPGHCPC